MLLSNHCAKWWERSSGNFGRELKFCYHFTDKSSISKHQSSVFVLDVCLSHCLFSLRVQAINTLLFYLIFISFIGRGWNFYSETQAVCREVFGICWQRVRIASLLVHHQQIINIYRTEILHNSHVKLAVVVHERAFKEDTTKLLETQTSNHTTEHVNCLHSLMDWTGQIRETGVFIANMMNPFW